MKKRLKELIRIAEAQGWQVSTTGGGHLRWTGPDDEGPVFTPSTPSDWRALKNATSVLRRHGLRV